MWFGGRGVSVAFVRMCAFGQSEKEMRNKKRRKHTWNIEGHRNRKKFANKKKKKNQKRNNNNKSENHDK